MVLPLRPIVTICGTTGVGKSKLAIELALHVNKMNDNTSRWRNAKIINADSMQVYKGLDIITNKVTESERRGISHSLMDFKQPGEQYIVGEWVQDTIKLIDEMHQNNELPIIVGGTSYWIQHLIFPNRLVSKETTAPRLTEPLWSDELLPSISSLPPELLTLLENLPQEAPTAKSDPVGALKLHSLLSALDPLISQRWHWRDTRKVLRNLEILKESGQRPSKIIMEQATATKDGKPRFHALCFWLFAEPAELGERLDGRVDDMISQGLVDEVRYLRSMDHTDTNIDHTLGIYQAIGFKEFCGYLDEPTDSSFKEAVERMKISTRQYAKRQISWIRNKLIPAVEAANTNENVVPFYLLDATMSGEHWYGNVQNKAARIQDAFLSQGELPEPKSLSAAASRMLSIEHKDVNPESILRARKRQICLVCTQQLDQPVMIEEGSEWHTHQKTRKHQRLAAKMSEKSSNNINRRYEISDDVGASSSFVKKK